MKPWQVVFLLCFVLVFSLQCSGSPPPTGRDLNRAVLMSRDACRQLLEVTAPEPAEGQGGGP